jgi:hypothetical protein
MIYEVKGINFPNRWREDNLRWINWDRIHIAQHKKSVTPVGEHKQDFLTRIPASVKDIAIEPSYSMYGPTLRQHYGKSIWFTCMIMHLHTAGEQYYCTKDNERVLLEQGKAYFVDIQTDPLMWDVKNTGMVYASIKFKIPTSDVLGILQADPTLELISLSSP